jgi:prevent-host-death family protein
MPETQKAKEVNVTQVYNQPGEHVNTVHYTGVPMILTNRGRPWVAIVPVEMLDRLLDLEESDDTPEEVESEA